MRSKGFEFKKKEENYLTLYIDGKKYRFAPLTLKVKRASDIFVQRAKPIGNKLNSKKLSQEELEKLSYKYCQLIADAINSILGKGSYDSIFGNRTLNAQEHDEVLTYIFEEIRNYQSNFSGKNEEHIDSKATDIN